jgi:hypothetical protein
VDEATRSRELRLGAERLCQDERAQEAANHEGQTKLGAVV